MEAGPSTAQAVHHSQQHTQHPGMMQGQQQTMSGRPSSQHQPPTTPSHSGLLPALSPSAEMTPNPIHNLPPAFQQQQQQQQQIPHPPRTATPSSHAGPGPSGHMQPPLQQTSSSGSMVRNGSIGGIQPQQPQQPQTATMQQQQMMPQTATMGQAVPPAMQMGNMGGPGGMMQQQRQQQQQQQQQQAQQQAQPGVFSQVMGSAPGQMPAASPQQGGAPARVYASVYSGIPVFEAMIRGISVMRRTADSWVNATQILKVAGIPKSARTKILEKEILSGTHEKVQGGYGKYQGTWIPFNRGQELAAQYGVTQYLAPIFDFVPSPTNVAALPVIRHGTPDRSGQKTPGGGGGAGHAYNPHFSAGRTPAPPSAAAAGRIYSPLSHSHIPPPPPPQFLSNDLSMMGGGLAPHPSAMAYPQNPFYQPHPDALQPAADINGYGLPPSHADVYIDQYGQPHPTHMNFFTTASDMGPPAAKRHRSGDVGQYTNGAAMEIEPEPETIAVAEEVAAEDEDEDSLDEPRDAAALPASMRLANKPPRPKASTNTAKTRAKLLSLFSATPAGAPGGSGGDTVDVREVFGLAAGAEPDFDVDMIIDNQGHTALHWACALAKMSIIAQLIALGADIHRGNYAGETPLIRSVLTTNHAEAGTFFPALLEQLAPSIRTLDLAYRSVLHHIALIAGVKGRASSARAYMAGVLEWVAKEQRQQAATAGTAAAPGAAGSDGGMQAGAAPMQNGSAPSFSLKMLVDVQDVHGDTALNVAARVGNKGLVSLLLDAGADKAKANKLGLKPADFGVETEALKVSPAEAVVSSLKAEVPKPERKSRDVQKNISAIFESISETFSNEMLQKQTKLNATEQSVRHATRALADKRQQVQRAQTALGEMEQIQQRSENVRRAVESVSEEHWTGRTLLSQLGEMDLPAAFRPVGPSVAAQAMAAAAAVHGEEIPLPERGDEHALVRLRQLALWEDRVAAVLQDKIQSLQGETAEKSVSYRRIVSHCTKVPFDKVDGMLDGLVAAIESDGQSIDLSRIATFMSRMKEQAA